MAKKKAKRKVTRRVVEYRVMQDKRMAGVAAQRDIERVLEVATKSAIPASNAECLTFGEFVNVVDIAKQNGVKVLRWRGLELSFGNSPTSSSFPSGDPQTSGNDSQPSSSTARGGKGSGGTRDSREAIEQELEDLKVLDPLAYEEHVLSEDVADGDGD